MATNTEDLKKKAIEWILGLKALLITRYGGKLEAKYVTVGQIIEITTNKRYSTKKRQWQVLKITQSNNRYYLSCCSTGRKRQTFAFVPETLITIVPPAKSHEFTNCTKSH